jgi:hypothetical protein
MKVNDMSKARRRPKPKENGIANRAVGGEVLQLRRGGVRLLAFWELVTPKIAAFYLQSNVVNRSLYERRVQEMVNDLENDRWYITHHAIAFDCDGNLIDGQHRLTAVVQSGKAMYCLIVRSVPKEHIPGVDVGKTRSAWDHSKMLGLGISTRHASCARAMLKYRENIHGFVSTPRLLEFARGHAERIDYALQALSPRVPGVTTAGVEAAFAWAVDVLTREQLDRAAVLLRKGEPPDDRFVKGDKTITALRRLLYNMYTKGKGHGGSSQQLQTYRLTGYALQCFAARRELQYIKVPGEYRGIHENGAAPDG